MASSLRGIERGNMASTLVPSPGWDEMTSLPPSKAARSRIPIMPNPEERLVGS